MYTINHIDKIYFTKYKRNKYFVIEYNENKKIVLNTSTGKDETNNNINLNNKRKYIYNEGHDYQEKIDLGKIKSIVLRSNVELLNKTNKKSVATPYIIEVTDTENNHFYVDACINQVFTRKNHYRLKLYDNSKEEVIFLQNEKTSLLNVMITLKLCNILKPIIAIDEEDII